jgi:hypothetical protein
MKDGDLWYWIGQDEGYNKTLNSGFNLYSSPDLVTWTFLGQPMYVSVACIIRILNTIQLANSGRPCTWPRTGG